MKLATRSITLAATLAALCAVTGFLPYVFFLPVTVAATTLSVGMAAFVGAAFGAVSIAYCFIMPSSFVAAAFIQAPYVALLPRVAAAIGAWGVFAVIRKAFDPQTKLARFAAVSVAAAAGSLFNTGLVVPALYFLVPELAAEGINVALWEMLISGAIECACMAALTPPVSLTLEKTVLLDKRSLRRGGEKERGEKECGEKKNGRGGHTTEAPGA